MSPPGISEGSKTLELRGPDGNHQRVVFSTQAAFQDQLHTACQKFGLRDAEAHVITQGYDVRSLVLVRSAGQLLASSESSKLCLFPCAKLVDLLLGPLPAACSTKSSHEVTQLLQNLFRVTYRHANLSKEVVQHSSFRFVFEAAKVGNVAAEAAMCCVCELLYNDNATEAMAWLEHNQEQVFSPALFESLLAAIFTDGEQKSGRVDKNKAEIARARADAENSYYARMVQIVDMGEDASDFDANAATTILGLLRDVASTEPGLLEEFEAEISRHAEAFGTALELLTGDDEDDELPQEVTGCILKASLGTSAELHASSQKQGSEEQLEKMQRLQDQVDLLKDSLSKMKADLLRRARQMTKMVTHMKVDKYPTVQKALEGIVRFGWDSVGWKGNYTLLHLAAEKVDDPSVVELVAILATDLDARDDTGKRPIDYAREYNPGVEKVLMKLRARERAEQTKAAGSTVGTDEPAFADQRVSSGHHGGASQGDSPAGKGGLEAALQRLDADPQATPSLRKIVKKALQEGWSNMSFIDGFTGLHLAAKLGSVEGINMLLTARADIALTSQDTWKCAPMDYAVQEGHEAAIACLASHVARRDGKPAVQEASRSPEIAGDGGTLDLSFSPPAVHIQSEAVGASSPSKRAAPKRRLIPPRLESPERKALEVSEAIRPELKKACEAIVNKGYGRMEFPQNFTPVHFAARLGSKDAVELLLKASAFPALSLRDHKGCRPLDLALEKGREDLLEILDPSLYDEPSQSVVDSGRGAVSRLQIPGMADKLGEEQDALDLSTSPTAEQKPLGRSPRPSFKKRSPRPTDGSKMSSLRVRSRNRADIAEELEDEKDLDELGLDELRAEIRRLSQEKATLQNRAVTIGESAESGAVAGSGLGGPIKEEDLYKYFVQYQTFGKDPVMVKLTESTISGGLALDREAAKAGMEQIESLQRVLGSGTHGPSATKQKWIDTYKALKLQKDATVASQADDAKAASGAPSTGEDTVASAGSPAPKGKKGKGSGPPPPGKGGKQTDAEAHGAQDEANADPPSESSGPVKGGKGPPPPGGKGPPAAGKGPPPAAGKGPPAPGGKGPPAPGGKAPGGKGPPAPGGKGPPAPGGKGPPAPGGKGPPPPGGKGPPAPGGKGPPAPGGKGPAAAPAGGKGAKGGGKGKGGKGGGGGGPEPSKPKITPKTPMKSLWWNKMQMLVNMQPGETIWDEVSDMTNDLTIDDLVARFSKSASAPKAKPKDEEGEKEKKEEVKLLRIITDPNVVVGKEASLKNAPPPQEVTQALIDLDDKFISMDTLRIIQDNACPDPGQMKQLQDEVKKNPTAELALPEKYMWAIGNMPAYKQRIDCWAFVRSYPERQEAYFTALKECEQVIECFMDSEMLPSLLGIVLAVGNYLNGGTSRGQADGFDLETLTKLDAIKDPLGKDIRHYIFDVYFNNFAEKAGQLIDELTACLANVSRRLNKDSDGTEKLNKSARYCIEDFDGLVVQLQKEYQANHETMQMVLQYLEDPTDAFRLRMPSSFNAAKEKVDTLVALKDRSKESYQKLLKWFKIAGMKSSDFCLIWDNFLVPGDMIVNASEKVKKEIMVPVFCQNKPFGLDELAVLWGFKDPDEVAKNQAKKPRRRAGGRRRQKTADKSDGDKVGEGAEAEDNPAAKPSAEGADTASTPTEDHAASEGAAVPATTSSAPPKGKGKAPPPGKGKGPAASTPTEEHDASEAAAVPATTSSAPPKGKGKAPPPGKGKGPAAPAAN